MNFFFRNPVYCVKSPRKSYAVTKAMKTHLKSNPGCAYCDRDNRARHVHHIEPISYAPELAADPNNFLTLCGKNCHIVIGHAGNWKNYVSNILTICGVVTIGMRRKLKSFVE